MRTYRHLSEKSAEKDPFAMFEKWYRQALASQNDYQGALSLATASGDGDVSVRTVLLKEYDSRGFVFYTGYSSRKGRQLEENNRAAMLFYWPWLNRQVRIEGKVQKLTPGESFRYFSTRPRESRTGAWASSQSSVLESRQVLLDRYRLFREKFRGKDIPLPPHWGGFRLSPASFEFWQEGKFRLHDRILYSPGPGGWTLSRLSP